MRKHAIAILTIIVVLCLGYGLWLYSENLRTGVSFDRLLKNDLSSKQKALNDFIAGEKDK